MGNKTVSLTEEAYKILVEEKRDNESFADVIVRLSTHGKLKDCFGAWDMDDEEEKEMFVSEAVKCQSLKLITVKSRFRFFELYEKALKNSILQMSV